MIKTILGFLASTAGRYLVIGVGAVALLGAFSAREQRKGANKVVAQVEKNNNAVAKKAAAAGERSRSPTAPGLRNPYYRPD